MPLINLLAGRWLDMLVNDQLETRLAFAALVGLCNINKNNLSELTFPMISQTLEFIWIWRLRGGEGLQTAVSHNLRVTSQRESFRYKQSNMAAFCPNVRVMVQQE